MTQNHIENHKGYITITEKEQDIGRRVVSNTTLQVNSGIKEGSWK